MCLSEGKPNVGSPRTDAERPGSPTRPPALRIKTEIHPSKVTASSDYGCGSEASEAFLFLLFGVGLFFNYAFLLSVKRLSQEKKVILQIYFYLALHAKAHCT